MGADYNEFLLELMANNGGGNYYFIESPAQIPQIFQLELNELTTITASGCEVDVEIPARVALEALGNWKSERNDQRITLFFGDIPAGQTRTAYMKLLCPPRQKSRSLKLEVQIHAKSDTGEALFEKAVLDLKYASRAEVHAAKLNEGVRTGSASVLVADAARQALELERAGKYQEARQSLERVLVPNMPYLSAPEKREYEHLRQKIEYGLNPMLRKQSHSTAYSFSRSIRRMDDEPKQPKSR